MKPMKMPPTKEQRFPLVGGLDIESSQLARAPGLVMGALNYESSAQNGYEALGRFEAFDGHPRPSDAAFIIIQASVAFTGVSVGQTVNGQTSGVTGKVIQVRAANQLVLTKLTGSGAFTATENIRVGTTVVGVYSRLADDYTSADENVFKALAAASYRADISFVPGTGPIRGIAILGTTVYAFRDNGAYLGIYKSTAAGWVNVPLLFELPFSAGGGTPPAEGATITKGGVSARVRRVACTTDPATSWGTNSAAGYFIVDNITGGTFTSGSFTGGVTATCGGAQSQIFMLAGGRLDHVVYNFTGSTDTERIYGCDGVNRGFEFDGDVLVPIHTGMTTDVPRHVACHLKQLFFAFKASVQNSGIKLPYAWSPILGSAEIGTGQEVTGFSNLPGDVSSQPLMIFSQTRTTVIYGSSSADWKMTTFSSTIGAQRWSVQNIGNPVVMCSLGITPIVQSQEFGNFSQQPASDLIRSLLANKVVTASVVNRNKTRLRYFFSDGSGLSITPVGDMLRFMPISYGKTVRCAVEANMGGVHRSFFGSDDGYVYEADVGRSFDGQAATSWLKLAFNHVQSPTTKKRFRKAIIEVKPQSYMSLQVQAEYSLGDINVRPSDVVTATLSGAGGRYDISAYDQCYYDSPDQTMAGIRLDGVGTSISLTYASNSSSELPHALQSTTTLFTPLRMER